MDDISYGIRAGGPVLGCHVADRRETLSSHRLLGHGVELRISISLAAVRKSVARYRICFAESPVPPEESSEPRAANRDVLDLRKSMAEAEPIAAVDCVSGAFASECIEGRELWRNLTQ